ncbi:MAG: hypothetical protein HC802_20000 [Caldilineaceae bacterium]|nr:hypothetical protein [Caldilineaceae bacterium]
MKEIETFRKYLIDEFYDDYRDGEISRRTFIRRVAYLSGGMAAAVVAMSAAVANRWSCLHPTNRFLRRMLLLRWRPFQTPRVPSRCPKATPMWRPATSPS